MYTFVSADVLQVHLLVLVPDRLVVVLDQCGSSTLEMTLLELKCKHSYDDN